MNHKFWRFEGVVLNVAPGLVTHRRIGLPIEWTDVPELAAFQVEHSRGLWHGIVLVIDHSDAITMIQSTIVIVSSKAREIRTDRRLADPPVEVHDVGTVFLHEFDGSREPIVGPRGGNVSEVVTERSPAHVHQPSVSRAVERGELRVVHVRRYAAAHTKEEVVFHSMRRDPKMQTFSPHGRGQLTITSRCGPILA